MVRFCCCVYNAMSWMRSVMNICWVSSTWQALCEASGFPGWIGSSSCSSGAQETFHYVLPCTLLYFLRWCLLSHLHCYVAGEKEQCCISLNVPTMHDPVLKRIHIIEWMNCTGINTCTDCVRKNFDLYTVVSNIYDWNLQREGLDGGRAGKSVLQ